AVVRSSQGSAGSHPSAWEPRVAPIAHFVEDVRGLTFLHPVAVEFLPEAAFKARFAADKKPTAKEQGQLSDVVSTLRALGLIQGDAVRVQQAFDKTLPTDQQQALDLTRTQQARGANETTKQADAPEVLADEFEFPYAFGPAFVALLRRQGGNGALDAAFRRPPRSEAQIVDPQSYLSGAVVVHVAAPQLGPGETRLDKPYDVGQVSLLTVFGARLDYEVAWEAVRAWTGDQAVAYRQSGRVCVAVDTAMQTTPAADFFAKTATQWAASMPAAASAGSSRLSPT